MQHRVHVPPALSRQFLCCFHVCNVTNTVYSGELLASCCQSCLIVRYSIFSFCCKAEAVRSHAIAHGKFYPVCIIFTSFGGICCACMNLWGRKRFETRHSICFYVGGGQDFPRDHNSRLVLCWTGKMFFFHSWGEECGGRKQSGATDHT